MKMTDIVRATKRERRREIWRKGEKEKESEREGGMKESDSFVS